MDLLSYCIVSDCTVAVPLRPDFNLKLQLYNYCHQPPTKGQHGGRCFRWCFGHSTAAGARECRGRNRLSWWRAVAPTYRGSGRRASCEQHAHCGCRYSIALCRALFFSSIPWAISLARSLSFPSISRVRVRAGHTSPFLDSWIVTLLLGCLRCPSIDLSCCVFRSHQLTRLSADSWAGLAELAGGRGLDRTIERYARVRSFEVWCGVMSFDRPELCAQLCGLCLCFQVADRSRICVCVHGCARNRRQEGRGCLRSFRSSSWSTSQVVYMRVRYAGISVFLWLF